MVNIIGADRFNEPQQYESGYFTLKLIKAATQNFSPANRISHWKGLYKGVLPDGMKITVKQLDEREDYVFKNEVKFLSTFRHPNLVRLLGQCTENNQRLLVYEYMENGSLSYALSGDNENLRKRLNWHTKMRICLGIANGLAFLHHKDDSKAIIVHRDIQPRSIFLDKFLDPKISYFGLTKHFAADDTHCTAAVGGAYAIGYDAPEYLTRGLITEKADVFSFGVSILVLSTEKKSFDLKRLANDEDLLLVDLAKDLHQKGELMSLIDEDLASSNSVKEATMLLSLAMLCTNESPELRPSMSEVVNILEGNTTMKTPPVDPLYMTTISYVEVMSEIESARSSSSHTMLKHDGFLYNPNDERDGKGGDGTLPYQVASKVKEDNTLAEVHNDFVSDLKALLSEGGEENDKVEYAKPSVETHEPYETAGFSLRYIEFANRSFSPANKIGQGSSGSTKNIDDISNHYLSSTAMHYGKDVSSNDVFDHNDGAATGTSSNGVSEVDEFKKDIGSCGDFMSNVNVSVGVWKSDMPLTQVTITSTEPMGLNVKPQTSSISKDTYYQKGVRSKLEFFEPSFEEGKLHIEFSDDEFRAVCDEWENSLIGFFVGEDVPFSMDIIMVEKLWEVKGEFSVFTIENGYFVFQFSCVEEKVRVLESAELWRVRQRQLILKEWHWKLMVERIGMESLPIWVKIYNLPLFFWTPYVLSKVGSGLGTPLYADQKTKNKEQLAYAMLCIEIDAKKPLPESLRILVKGMEYHLKLEYDWRPLRCENCCVFGHIALNCKLKMKANKQN